MAAARDIKFLIALLLAGVAAADDGDDFSNNLFSDLAPLLALFGERVTMQFMSQSMGWADNFILAMAPLGIITAVVSAIRVGGPSWLKAIIGRARENLAAAEADLMSSTSEEVCELWNGREVVRCMGSAPVTEFICLFPEDMKANPKLPPVVKTMYLGIQTKRYLQKIELDFRGDFRRWRDSGNLPSHRGDTGGNENGTHPPPQEIIIIRKKSAAAPNISLNSHNQSWRGELRAAAVFGTFLQLGVLAYSGFATYYPTMQFPKDDSPIANYAFPCTAVGTLVLVLGMLICGHVVESSTTETRRQPREGMRARLVWLQQTKTVSDQVFESFAVFAHDDRVFITTSRRANNKDDSDDDSDDEFDDEPKAKSKDKSAPSGNMGVQTAPVNKGHSILLQTKTIVGTMISLSGFIIQFVGLRGMHWSVSIAQLGAVLVMAGLRAWVRRGLANPPNCRRLSSRFELDWFAMTLADLGTAPWMDPSEDDDTKHSGPCCEWSVETGGDPDIHQPFEERKGTDEGEDVRPLSNAQRVMTIRRDLGELADWLGPATAQAVAIARSIEITMDSLFQHVPEKNYSWSLKACGGESVKFRLDRQQNGRWKAYADEIEAALSLWLYSVSEKERDHGQEQRKQTALESPHSKDDAWLRAKGSPAKRSLRLLGPNKGALHQDLQWWMPDGATQVAKVHLSEPTGGDETWMEVERHRIVGSGNRSGLDSGYRIWEPPESASDDIASYDIAHGDDEANSLLAIELYGPLESLYAQDMFSSFMWAAAKTLKEPVNGHADIRPKDISDDDAWKSFTFRNDNLSRMAHDIQSTGLGSLEDIFLCILPPLSVEHKLPKSDAIIDLAREQAKRQEQLKHWDKAAAAYIWLFRTAKIFPQQSGIATKATALLIEYLRQVTSSIKLKKAQFDIMYIYILRDVERRLRKELKTIDQGALSGFIRLYEDQGRGWKCDLVHEDNSADTTYPATFNVTELHRLAQTLEVDLQELYLSGKRRRRVNLKDIYDWTPLHYAAAKGCPDAVETLTDVAADVNARDLLEWTPLHYACQRGEISIVQILIKTGADVGVQGRDGVAPLHCAAMNGHKEVVALLTESGAGIDVLDASGNTPLLWAAYKGHIGTVEYLWQDASKKLRDHQGRNALHLASIGGAEEVVRWLVSKVSTIKDTKDRIGRISLHYAAISGRERIVRLLVEELGVDKDDRDHANQTPLHGAAINGQEGTVRLLVEELGADIEAKGSRGQTPLLLAAMNGHEGTVRLLVEELGADIEAKDSEGQTPLHFAASSGWEGTARLLIEELGADVEAKDNSGRTILHWAAIGGHKATARLLAEEPRADIGVKDKDGMTPLHWAVMCDREAVARLLVQELGADIEAKDNDGMTPLHWAGTEAIARLLVELGADEEAKDNKGQGPSCIRMI